MEDTAYTYADFIVDYGVDMRFQNVAVRPDGLMDDGEHKHYRVTLHHDEGGDMETYYSQGRYYVENGIPPVPHEVIACLAMDALSYETARDGNGIDDFAEELCIEKPSEAIRLYGACEKIHADLGMILGDDGRDRLLYDTEEE